MLINFYCSIIKQSIDCNLLIGKQQWIRFYVGMFVITFALTILKYMKVKVANKLLWFFSHICINKLGWEVIQYNMIDIISLMRGNPQSIFLPYLSQASKQSLTWAKNVFWSLPSTKLVVSIKFIYVELLVVKHFGCGFFTLIHWYMLYMFMYIFIQ